MKKILFVFLSLLLLTNLFNVNAAEPVVEVNDNTEVIYYEDGSYLVIEITESTNPIQPRAPFYKNGSKEVTKYNSDNEILWIYTLNCTFYIEIGQYAQCTSASYTVDNYDDSWKFSDGSTSTLNNIGYGKGLFKHKLLGITIQKVEIDISLSSDIYSNLS